jgi:hypothetical protein
MDFIIAPLVCFVVFSFAYGIFELFVRRKERLNIIEKIGDKLDVAHLQSNITLPSFGGKSLSFGALKGGCLLMGIGIGLLVGLLLNVGFNVGFIEQGIDFSNWQNRNLISVAYGAPVLIFGGLGLLIAFTIETKMSKKKD